MVPTLVDIIPIFSLLVRGSVHKLCHNELLLGAVDFSFDFLVNGNSGFVMPFSFLIGGVGEVPEDDEVAGLPLKLFLLGVSASGSRCKLNCFWKLVFLPRFLR